VSNEHKGKLSAKDLRELGAHPRPRRAIAPDGRQRVEIPEEPRPRGANVRKQKGEEA
jgi:hypothetical protein